MGVAKFRPWIEPASLTSRNATVSWVVNSQGYNDSYGVFVRVFYIYFRTEPSFLQGARAPTAISTKILLLLSGKRYLESRQVLIYIKCREKVLLSLCLKFIFLLKTFESAWIPSFHESNLVILLATVLWVMSERCPCSRNCFESQDKSWGSANRLAIYLNSRKRCRRGFESLGSSFKALSFRILAGFVCNFFYLFVFENIFSWNLKCAFVFFKYLLNEKTYGKLGKDQSCRRYH